MWADEPRAESQPTQRPLWHELLLCAVSVGLPPLVHHAGKAIREWLTSRRSSTADAQTDPTQGTAREEHNRF